MVAREDPTLTQVCSFLGANSETKPYSIQMTNKKYGGILSTLLFDNLDFLLNSTIQCYDMML